MSGVFLDTAGLVAILDTTDRWHALAERVWSEIVASPAPILTTSLVLIELADGLSRINHRKAAKELRDRLAASARVEIVQITAAHEGRAWDLFGRRIDKEWGMTDCVSIIVAQDQHIRDVFTTDHHFKQAGFNILLTDNS